MSLPYPSMTFVPLDVLTAEEMNQLVANIESLATMETYSTTEQVVGTWKNGKPLYRKVVPFGALPNNTTKEIQLNGTGAGVIRLVKVDAYMTADSSMQIYARPIPYWTDGSERITCYWSEYIYRIGCNYDASSFEANIIEYYWKATD